MPSLRTMMIVCALVIFPAAGQSPSGARKSIPPADVPDLQGVWSFQTLTTLERPAEFAGKATLTEQEAADYARRAVERSNKDNRAGGADADVQRAYNDVWWDYGTKALRQTSLIVDPPDGKLPPMTAEGQKRAEISRFMMNGVPNGPEDRPVWERCIMGFNAGPPMLPSAYNNNMQIVQTRDTIAIQTEMVHNVRVIPIDGRPHGTVRQWAGDSRAHWEGATLVVDTVNFMPEGTGTIGLRVRFDENLHLTERFTRKDAHTLLYEATVDDPTVWTKPWTVSVPMAKQQSAIYEYACHEGNYAMAGMLSAARAEEAEAAKKTESK